MQYRVIAPRDGDLYAGLVLAWLRESFPNSIFENHTCEEGYLPGTTQVANLLTARQLFLIWDEKNSSLISKALLRNAAAVIGPSSVDDLTEAVLALEVGAPIFIPAALLHRLAQEGSQLAEFGMTRKEVYLTPREREVLGLLGKAFSNCEIADKLSISTNTVRTHLASMSQKFQVTGRAKLVASARNLGFLQ